MLFLCEKVDDDGDGDDMHKDVSSNSGLFGTFKVTNHLLMTPTVTKLQNV